ncbi:MAG: SiaB family protein kinase [Salibacteraceae bacterium]|mgnify:CR=1 FL=1
MDIESTLRFYKQLEGDDLSFIYQGNFNDDITNRVIDLSERNMDSQGQHTRIIHRVSFLLAECFQNIVRYGEEGHQDLDNDTNGIFLTRHVGSKYYIISGNLILHEKVDELTKRLDDINTMGKDELKKLYLQVLSGGVFSDKGGAGLGLIEMARKSGEKLLYDFERINDTYAFFYLQISLKSDDAPSHKAVSVANSRDIRKQVVGENILMIHRGDFNQDTFIPVLRMIENNMRDKLDKYSLKRMVYHVMVELLQNIYHHGKVIDDRRDGIFIVSAADSHYLIQAGNFIDNSEIEDFQRQLEIVNRLGRDELKELYKKTLAEGKVDEVNGAGLGLIDIRRDTTNPLEFTFLPIDDSTSFFSVSVRV